MSEVSVIIPTYNRAYIVKDAIGSILAQTFHDIEVLVIDDGSTDNTPEVINSIGDERVRYHYKENGGVSSARNFGIIKAKGNFIAFLDSDDIWPENFIETTLGHLNKNPNAGLAYTATTIQHPDGRQEDSRDTHRCVSGRITVQLFKHSFIWPMAVLIRKDVLDGFFFDENLKICDDNDAFLRLSVKNDFVFVPDTKVRRRYSQDNHSNKFHTTGSFIRGLSLERFYFQMDGHNHIPVFVARKKLAQCYRRASRRHREQSYRTAAIKLAKKAIKYNPTSLRMYSELLKAYLISKDVDKCPEWKMPAKLGPPYTNLSDQQVQSGKAN